MMENGMPFYKQLNYTIGNDVKQYSNKYFLTMKFSVSTAKLQVTLTIVTLTSSKPNRINEVVKRAVEHGFTKHFLQKTERLMSLPLSSDVQKLQPSENISFEDLIFMFILYATAVIFSTFVFAIEILISRNYLKNILKT